MSEKLSGFAYTPGTGWMEGTADTVFVDCTAGAILNGGHMTIGGSTCHLCGERIASRTVEEWRGKKRWKRTEEVGYECGTTVFTDSKGKNLVYVGSDCIRMKGVV